MISFVPVDINTWRAATGLFENVTMGLSSFYLTKCFRCILLITILFLLFTVHFYDKDLGMMAFLSLDVNSINMKGTFFSKFSIKCFTCTYVRMFFCSLLFLILVILLLLSGDVETNPGPNPGYSNSFFFCHWNLNSIAAITLLRCLHCKLTTLYIGLIL